MTKLIILLVVFFVCSSQTKDIAWGCVLADSKMECMKAVLSGSAELMNGNPTETFIAGREFKLQPILSQQFDTLVQVSIDTPL